MVVFPMLGCLIWAKLPDINNDDDKNKAEGSGGKDVGNQCLQCLYIASSC